RDSSRIGDVPECRTRDDDVERRVGRRDRERFGACEVEAPRKLGRHAGLRGGASQFPPDVLDVKVDVVADQASRLGLVRESEVDDPITATDVGYVLSGRSEVD